jgi:hypothetical protein
MGEEVCMNRANGSFTCKMDISDCVEHLSRLSQQKFHQELFTVILYNLAMKQATVRTAGYCMRNKADAHTCRRTHSRRCCRIVFPDWWPRELIEIPRAGAGCNAMRL